MQAETIRNEASDILKALPDVKLTKALNYLRLLRTLSDDQIDAIEELMENVGWSLLASEVAEDS